MTTYETQTIVVSIDADPIRVATDLADPVSHPEWAVEFFSGPVRPRGGGEYVADIALLGGPARFRIDADVERGIVDLYLAPEGRPFGQPLPVRLVPNGDGVDVLWTLARPPGVPDDAWGSAIASMRRELENLRRRHESSGRR